MFGNFAMDYNRCSQLEQTVKKLEQQVEHLTLKNAQKSEMAPSEQLAQLEQARERLQDELKFLIAQRALRMSTKLEYEEKEAEIEEKIQLLKKSPEFKNEMLEAQVAELTRNLAKSEKARVTAENQVKMLKDQWEADFESSEKTCDEFFEKNEQLEARVKHLEQELEQTIKEYETDQARAHERLEMENFKLKRQLNAKKMDWMGVEARKRILERELQCSKKREEALKQGLEEMDDKLQNKNEVLQQMISQWIKASKECAQLEDEKKELEEKVEGMSMKMRMCLGIANGSWDA